MMWLERLKAADAAGAHATKPSTPGCVGFVAAPRRAAEKSHAEAQALDNAEVFEVGGAIPAVEGMVRSEEDDLLVKLVEAAMRACDHWGDGPAARAEMRRQCLETPEHLRHGLLEHLNRAYPRSGPPAPAPMRKPWCP